MRVSLYSIIIAALCLSNPVLAEMITKESQNPVDVTISKLVKIVTEKGFKVFARIDHAVGAKSVNQELRPTELLIFGNPNGGTPMIAAEQTMGLTLPLKVLAWQDEAGKVWIGYDDMRDLLATRGLPKDHPAGVKAAGALDIFTNGAAAK